MRVTIRNFYKNREAFIKGASLFLLDIILTIGCMVGALWLRFDFGFTKIEPVFWDSVRDYMWINVVCTVAINALCKLYTSLWRFASLEELKKRVRDVAGRARKGGLSMDEITGGSFTISNVSMLGVDGFTPVLNPPETAILGVGRVQDKPAVHEGTICVRKLMTLSLTFNHMVTDGGPAMNFLRCLADMLERPVLMLA